MRLLIAVPHFPPLHVAGAELRAYRLARWLLEQGNQVQVVCIEQVRDTDENAGLIGTEEVYDGIAVQRLSCHHSAWQGSLPWAFDNLLLLRHLRHMIDGYQPDVIHLISGYLVGTAPLLAAQEAGVPAVVTLTDFWFLCPKINLLRGDGSLCWGPDTSECVRCWLNRWRPFHWMEAHAPILTQALAQWLQIRPLVPAALVGRRRSFAEREQRLRQALNDSQALLSVTQFLADIHTANGISPDLFHVISYRQPIYSKSALPAGSPDRHGTVRFAYLGQVFPHKGVDVLVRAFRRLGPKPRASLTIFGSIQPASFERHLLRLADGHPGIHFAGHYENEKLGEILAQVDVVVVPSLWHENAPRTIIEAFQHGKPVIGSDVGGIAALVNDGRNGLLFKRGNPDSLLSQLRRVVDEPGLLPSLRSDIPQLETGGVENEKVLSVYRQVLRGRAGQVSDRSEWHL